MTIWQTITNAASAIRTEAVAPLLDALGIRAPDDGQDGRGVAFTIAIIALSAKMAKSDGFVVEDEVAAFRRVCRFDDREEANFRRVFDLAKRDIAGFESYASQIGKLLAREAELRLDVLEGLYVIAAADGILHEREDSYLQRVATLMGISESEHAWVRSLFVSDAADPYTTLGLTPQASNDEIRRRHRALVKENHPDRLMGDGVPPEFVLIAEKRLAAINAAFDRLARDRGL